ncbi:MAG: DNA recombination protein RmuC [Muribaculaceae bacterium]|nr:DNA recombination protein RmuC [Muribaculaceae bacterium]
MTVYYIFTAVSVAAAIVFLILYIRSNGELSQARTHNARLEERQAALAAEHERMLAEHSRQQAQAEERFRALASKVLVANSEALREQNRHGLAEVLAPMKSDLENFRRLFTERYDREAGERFALGERIRDLVSLNHAIGQETRRLTDALKGNAKVQGDWGEMILDNILDRCGFRRGEDYMVQETVAVDSGGRLRPDVVISYSEGRKLVIDSKVSIQDYLAMLNAETDESRERYARAHVASVRGHVAELSRKSYQDFVGDSRLDFVLMFIPHEGAYMAAMNLDPALWQTAFDSHVLIISPTHLMSVIRLVEQMWRRDKQDRNAREIARQASAMLDKFRGFVDDLDKIDAALGSARTAWNNAFSKLTSGNGNLVARAQKIAALGAKGKKPLPGRYTPDELPEDASEDVLPQERDVQK